jgi:hypothetical protein
MVPTMKALVALFVSTVAAAGSASDYRTRFPLPDLTVPNGWGVNIHFTDPGPGELELLAREGFKWVRMDFAWGGIEREKGRYDFSAYDRLTAALSRKGIRAVYILDYGNDLYEKASPHTPEAVAAFAAFAARSVSHFRGRGILWEMWNEPNIGFWKPNPNVEDYARLATAVGKAIRNAAPEEWYVGPATSGFDWTFLEGCFKAGLLEYWDAVSVHPYRGSNPETVTGDWARLKALAAKYGRRHVPLLSGEWGYSELYGGIDRNRQAQYAVRQYLTNLASGVGLSIWYDWKDDGLDPRESEHHFGTVYPDLKPKEAFAAVAGTTAALRGKRFLLRLAQASEDDWLCVFVGRGGAAAIGWSTRDPERAMPKLADTTIFPAEALTRATRWVPLPPYANVARPADLAAILKPLVENLRAGERLQVSDSRASVTLHAEDSSRLAELCRPFSQPRTVDERVWRLRVELHGAHGSVMCQECQVTGGPPHLTSASVPFSG